MQSTNFWHGPNTTRHDRLWARASLAHTLPCLGCLLGTPCRPSTARSRLARRGIGPSSLLAQYPRVCLSKTLISPFLLLRIHRPPGHPSSPSVFPLPRPSCDPPPRAAHDASYQSLNTATFLRRPPPSAVASFPAVVHPGCRLLPTVAAAPAHLFPRPGQRAGTARHGQRVVGSCLDGVSGTTCRLGMARHEVYVVLAVPHRVHVVSCWAVRMAIYTLVHEYF